MSTNRLCAAEKDLEKFIKFLALKSAQVVVQSRLGEKIQTQCNPHATGNDWVCFYNWFRKFGKNNKFEEFIFRKKKNVMYDYAIFTAWR